jgi:mannose-6-phosphate isomerase-like protein (cupin superfamily)
MRMQSFYTIDEIRKQLSSKRPYAEFLRVAPMSCGVYVLQPGEVDRQTPHNEDEIYYVVSGTAHVKVTAENQSEQDRAISAGDVIFVKAHQEHRFHSIIQELVLLVVFAPAMTR